MFKFVATKQVDMDSNNRFWGEQPENVELQELCILVIDTSSRMSALDIYNVQETLDDIFLQLNPDGPEWYRESALELGIVTFDQRVHCLRLPSYIQEKEPAPKLTKGIGRDPIAALNEALDIVAERKEWFCYHHLRYRPAQIIFISSTDISYTTESPEYKALEQRIQSGMQQHKFRVFGVETDPNTESMPIGRELFLRTRKINKVEVCEDIRDHSCRYQLSDERYFEAQVWAKMRANRQ